MRVSSSPKSDVTYGSVLPPCSVGRANTIYNMRRFLFLERISAAA
ncbi:hypothetical protein S101446_02049 [Komagataeibacter europaeus]|nr:hypothetical protein S101446_02049 [Komagataeibacter europaeus]